VLDKQLVLPLFLNPDSGQQADQNKFIVHDLAQNYLKNKAANY